MNVVNEKDLRWLGLISQMEEYAYDQLSEGLVAGKDEDELFNSLKAHFKRVAYHEAKVRKKTYRTARQALKSIDVREAVIKAKTLL